MSHGIVLITGITGFIATHTALAFLEAGYSVRGTARTATKAERWIAQFPAHKDRFVYAVVSDMVSPGAFDDAVKGCDFIVHIASPTHWNQNDNEADLLIPAINGTKYLLFATKVEPRIKRVNPVTFDEAKASDNAALVYRASKALVERAFWNYIKDEKPAWAGSTICPCRTFAPPIQPLDSLSALNVSVAFMWDMANGKYKAGVPKVGSPVYVDARDVALAHVRAIEREVAKGQRYLLIGGTYVPDQFIDTIHHHFPELRDNLPPFDLSKVQKELGIEFTSIEIMVVDTIRFMLSLKN
ncbi:NAD-P-binding protein [Mycena maculata]|uniref:NAD-P-binding protein n=1 Tax=Mycena maculata TaxID=230809 RepID=A0AAD7MPA1_9AGAR|nr:NAD-P-binding protein [Mycena maculata]